MHKTRKDRDNYLAKRELAEMVVRDFYYAFTHEYAKRFQELYGVPPPLKPPDSNYKNPPQSGFMSTAALKRLKESRLKIEVPEPSPGMKAALRRMDKLPFKLKDYLPFVIPGRIIKRGVVINGEEKKGIPKWLISQSNGK